MFEEVIFPVLWQSLMVTEEVMYPQIPPEQDIKKDPDVTVICPALPKLEMLPFLAYPKMPTYCKVEVIR